MRLIDADELKEKIRKAELNLSDCEGCYMASPECCRNCFEQEIEGIIDESYMLDAEPVRHGQWVRKVKDEFHFGFECPLCKIPSEYPHSYCQYCGAKLDLEDE